MVVSVVTSVKSRERFCCVLTLSDTARLLNAGRVFLKSCTFMILRLFLFFIYIFCRQFSVFTRTCVHELMPPGMPCRLYTTVLVARSLTFMARPTAT